MTAEEVTVFIQEWQNVKPQINELAALKADLAIILAEVNRQSELTNLPPQYAGQLQVDHIEAEEDDYLLDEAFESDPSTVAEEGDDISDDASEGGMSMPAEEGNAQLQRQPYAAHLAYFISLPAARQGWSRVTRQFPALQGAVQVKVFTERMGEQMLHSLRIGPFETEMASNRVCQVFKTLNFKCRAVMFEGEDITVGDDNSRVTE
ncbi:hypothetical protein [Alteromonas gilva]|uniref:SPOR domain-containing protein n=1 Tax=Alteromonas gilva TaxID=2987522 RepID=A0ABT5KYQ5_9ALTE|nr:hypothetical protein [Alteromonas gilva]MDC8829768.1 hypothetical protein [Alteromonas gilva]